MNFIAGFSRFKAALAHWGRAQYAVVMAFWFVLSIPLYMAGWGIASVLSLPLMLLAIIGLASIASSLFKRLPVPVAVPRQGFPDVLEHPVIGRFTLSPYSNALYERTIDWCGASVKLSLAVDSMDSLGAVLTAADHIVDNSASLHRQIAELLIKELLPDLNRERQPSNAPLLSSERFLQTISLETIMVHADQTYAFIYQDGGLLGDHWIQVHGSIGSGPTEVDTPG